ncbi:uncharacterized protein [Dendropsophus ebraccatus]|uniref:uncharacterized protein n=1 Tax=Dendropsophus ebraccatus TaxID=150705 RepID=UPI003831A58A
MAATSMKIMNHQKGIFAPKMLQANHGKFIATERLLKKPVHTALNEDSFKVEDKIRHADGVNGFKSIEQGKMIKVCVRQRKDIYRPSVDNWADLTSNSKDYRKSLALTASGKEAQNMTRSPAAVNNKRPFLVSDVGHSFLPHNPERSSVHFSQDRKISYSEIKNQASNPRSKTQIATANVLKKEPLSQGIQDICCPDTSLRHGIPFNYSNKRVVLKNNVLHPVRTTDPYKRIKICDDTTSTHNVGRICQKMFYQQVPHRQTSTIPSTYSNNTSSVTCKTDTNGMSKDKAKSSPTDEIKGGMVHFKEKDKTESSTQRRFLLIDSQGMPYTVVVEEPLSIGLSNSSGTSPSGSMDAGVSKSSAPRKVYKCPVCFRIFEYLSYLQRHSIAHSQQKPHVCKVCGKAFKRTSHLTRHKYTHFGGKPCQCQICQRRFRDAGELARHHLSHTEEKNH